MEEHSDKLNIDGDPDMLEDEDENTEERIKERNNQLIKFSIEGDVEKVRRLLDKGANLFYEEPKKKWNSLIWACCKGNAELVRLLLERGAGEIYKPKTSLSSSNMLSGTMNNVENVGDAASHPKPATEKKNGQGVINNSARSTPLQWACFKGQPHVLCILLKDGQDLLETDSFGNNAIHQAAAGGSFEAMDILFQYGIKLDYKNNRGHSIADLCTNPKVLKYIQKYENTKDCLLCKKVFAAGQVKYLCAICSEFVCKDCCQHHWLYETKDSTIKEKLENRCNKCHDEVLKIQHELTEVMKTYSFTKLTEMLEFISRDKIHVEVKLLDQAKIFKEKLRTQIMIMDFINGLKEVENYKTIKKSINQIHEMIEDAKQRNVDLDDGILEKVYTEVARLEAERNLRFEVDNLSINNAKPEEVKMLEELKHVAQERNVAQKYITDAETLSVKMQKNIEAKNIFKNFLEYPIREFYPPPYYLDIKTKKYMDASTKKPIDPKLLQPPPVKKGKKAPKWVIPEWATETPKLGSQIKLLEEHIVNRERLELDEEFLKLTAEQLVRIKKEWKYRNQVDNETKILTADPKKIKK